MTTLIEAARQALEALEYLATQIKSDYEHSKAITSLRQAIEQADNQKPVAEIREDMKGGGYIEWLDDTYFVPGTKFYTQPQREWVGLTDEDLANCSGHEVRWALFWEKLLKGKNT